MCQRWCIYIDILGFSKIWECDEYKVLKSLGELMRAIYRIGTRFIQTRWSVCLCIRWEMALP